MASNKLKAYLAYYQKTLKEDPENIEARLRLAALFRQMGRVGHAVEQYVTASKLLAAQSLPLEAIAACKAVLELDPTHTEVQFFLAKLFAQAPGATSNSARIAQPLDSPDESGPRFTSHLSSQPPSSMVELDPTPRDSGAFLPLIDDEAPTKESTPTSLTLPVEDETVPEALSPSLVPFSPLPELSPEDEEDEDEEDDLPTQVHASVSRMLGQEPVGSLADEFATEPLTEDQEEEARQQEQRFISPHNEPTRLAQDFLMPIPSMQEDFPELEAMLEEAESVEALRETQDIDLADVLEVLTARNSSKDTTVREASFEVGGFDLGAFDQDEVNVEVLQEISDELRGEISSLSESSSTQTGEMPRHRVEITQSEIPKIPLFNRLNQDAFIRLLQQVEVHELEAGAVVLAPGHQKRSLFIVVRGEFEVFKQAAGGSSEPIFLSRFTEGDFFGEFTLLTGTTGHATVRGVTPTTVLEVTERMVHDISEYDPNIWDTLWDYYHVRMLNNLMASHPIWGHLTQEWRSKLIPLFNASEFVQGEIVLSPSARCEHVSLVLFGSLAVYHHPHQPPAAMIRAGEFFGFVSSLSNGASGVQIVASEDTTLLQLPAALFRQVTRHSREVAAEIRKLLKTKKGHDQSTS